MEFVRLVRAGEIYPAEYHAAEESPIVRRPFAHTHTYRTYMEKEGGEG